ncbi:hypothetical protein A3759_06200 [Thalassolituus sp. HI0120]|nr:hypothetical protein A3759_06200 [Thalassolituus sp. HI0120]
MRTLVIFGAAMAMIACSSTPRVGDDSGADYPVQIQATSSKALIKLNETGITGVRDLSVSEFEGHKEDYEKFLSLSADARSGGNSTAYAATSAAIGSGLGLALDFAGGLAILGKLAADDRPLNYDFADDYRSSYALYSTQNMDAFMKELDQRIPTALENFNRILNELYGIPLDDEIFTHFSPANAPGNRVGVDAYESMGIVSQKVNGKRERIEFYFSVRGGSNVQHEALAKAVIRFRVQGKHNPNVALLLAEIAKVLPEGTVMYAPPRRDVYQLPGVYLAGGEHLLLVEGK